MGSLWTEVGLLHQEQNLAPDAVVARSVVARLIADGTDTTRTDLVKATGLARSTIENHLSVLLDHDLIEDGGLGPQSNRGRPAQAFRISAGKGVILVADVSSRTTRLAVTTLDKQIVARDEIFTSVDDGPDQVLDAIASSFESMLTNNALSEKDALVISVGLPGPVDAKLGIAVRPPLMPGWDGIGVCRFFAQRFGCDVIVDNDVNLMALGEARSYRGEFLPLLMISIGTGVGGGFVSESGLLLHGADGAAADIGHTKVPAMLDALCRCGNHGCLEAVASLGAMADRVSGLRKKPVSEGELFDLLVRGDPTTVSVVRESATIVGQAVADLVNFCNPARIVLAGAITQCTEDILAQIRSVVYQQAQPLATRNLSLMHSTLGNEAGLIGGMISGIEQVLSPRGIAYHTRHSDSTMLPLGL
ncbi:ROK family transcriptional regulator [Arthrobacter sp. YA7-1]|jgi:predicted NBD/HSP70 family sugar kinase|uniref:ROK family transcriptional regulator n=1 Tax=Arthrobacter sp. YA7-1 TaxID=2987701 RepID=UPI0022262CBA|nr:ROK family transcriptional regulator [Arthrobacter sp. YA7-1]UYY83118.1 ROK family transcriptional regulator [Arthrobacter sp. YA7-1]